MCPSFIIIFTQRKECGELGTCLIPIGGTCSIAMVTKATLKPSSFMAVERKGEKITSDTLLPKRATSDNVRLYLPQFEMLGPLLLRLSGNIGEQVAYR